MIKADMDFKVFFEETQVIDRFAPYLLDQEKPYVLMDVDKLDQAWKKSGQAYVSKGGEGGISGRYELFAKFWTDGNTIIAPLINVSKNGKVEFNNGRHRFAYLRDQGVKQIPVSIDADDLETAKKKGLIIKVLAGQKGIREFQTKKPDGP